MMDFSSHAGAPSDFDILPNGQLAYAILNVRGVKGSASGGEYVDCELTIAEGQPYAGRKLWAMIGNPFHQGNSEKYRQMGMIAITRILEAGRGAGPSNPAAYKLDDFRELSGLRVPIKIGIEKGSDGHDDKNKVAEWLTPNPASQSGHKWFVKLQQGVFNASQESGASAPATSGFGGATGPATPAPQTARFGNGGNAGANAAPGSNAPGGAQSGFPQPQPASSAPEGVNNAGSAASGSSQTGANASPSDPAATPGWLSQAGGSAAPQ